MEGRGFDDGLVDALDVRFEPVAEVLKVVERFIKQCCRVAVLQCTSETGFWVITSIIDPGWVRM